MTCPHCHQRTKQVCITAMQGVWLCLSCSWKMPFQMTDQKLDFIEEAREFTDADYEKLRNYSTPVSLRGLTNGIQTADGPNWTKGTTNAKPCTTE